MMKSKWIKQTMAILMGTCMLATMVTGCGDGFSPGRNAGLSAGGKDVSYPVDTEIELSWYVQGGVELQSSYLTAQESPFHSGLSEVTGIDIDWQFPVEGANKTSAYEMLLQEEELPHIISGYVFNSTEATELMEDGLIVDLTDYLETYAPDYYAYITAPENEADYNSMLTAGGKIYGFGGFCEEDFNVTYLGPVIRKDWLDECGLEEPVTLKDWENVLVKFKEKYGAVMSFALDRFRHGGISSGTGAFGATETKYFIDENQKIQLGNAQVEWREMLEVLHRWNEMNLIDKDFATNTDNDVRAKVLRNEVGVSFTAMSQMSAWIEDAKEQNMDSQWVGLSYPREAEGVPTKFIYTTSGYRINNNAAVITTSCSEQEIIAACKLLNYGFTEDGILYWNYGFEGETYTLDANGTPQFTELITQDPLGISEACKKYTGTHSAGISIQLRSYVEQKYSPEASEAVNKWIANTDAKKYVVPTLPMTVDDSNKIADYQSLIGAYVSEMALKFITGEEKLTDDGWNKYLKQLEDYGLSEMLKLRQKAYDAYLDK